MTVFALFYWSGTPLIAYGHSQCIRS